MINDEATPGATLPAGVYQVRVTAGSAAETRTTVRTDALGSRDLGRILGLTSADGTLTAIDRTAAPSRFGTGPVPFFDEFGNFLQTFVLSQSVRVVALNDGSVVGTTTATLRDGGNRVRVRLAPS